MNRLKSSTNRLSLSFISPYSFSNLFIKIISSWLIFELIKALKIKTSIPINLAFANNIILSWSHIFFLYLIIDLYFLIPQVIAQIFNSIAEQIIPTGIPRKEAKVEIEIHPVIAGAEIRKCSI